MNNSISSKNSQRVGFIDISKGLSIFLVVYSHCYVFDHCTASLNTAFGIFRLPFFFLLSGIFFSTNRKILNYSIYKFDVLVKPFVFMVFIICICKTIISGSLSSPYGFFRMLYGTGNLIGWPWTAMWFLPHLWVIFVFSSAIFKAIGHDKQSKSTMFLIAFTLMIIGSYAIKLFWNIDVNVLGVRIKFSGLPFSTDLVLFSSSYFILGHTLKEHILIFRPNNILFILGCLFISVSTYYFGAQIDLNMRVINNPILAIASSLIGIYCALTLAHHISRLAYINKLFLLAGSYSLYILIFHGFIYFLIRKALGESLSNLGQLIAFLASCTLPILIGIMISKNALLSLFFKPLITNKLGQLNKGGTTQNLPTRLLE